MQNTQNYQNKISRKPVRRCEVSKNILIQNGTFLGIIFVFLRNKVIFTNSQTIFLARL